MGASTAQQSRTCWLPSCRRKYCYHRGDGTARSQGSKDIVGAPAGVDDLSRTGLTQQVLRPQSIPRTILLIMKMHITAAGLQLQMPELQICTHFQCPRCVQVEITTTCRVWLRQDSSRHELYADTSALVFHARLVRVFVRKAGYERCGPESSATPAGNEPFGFGSPASLDEQLPTSTGLWADPLQQPDKVQAQASSNCFLSSFSAFGRTDYHLLQYHVLTYTDASTNMQSCQQSAVNV